MTKIFISYRRTDTLAIAGRIFDRLAAKFGQDGVFMDIDTIPFGVDFQTYLDEAVSRAGIVLVLIGQGWAEARDGAGRLRLDNPDDFVRIEVESALKRNIAVVPVLIGGAHMPRAEQLPESLRPLLRRHAAPVDMGRDFHVHMDRLIAGLDLHLNGASVPAPSASPNPGGGRIEIDAAIPTSAHGRWFLPGAGKTERFKDMGAGPEMVVVPAGQFMMGSLVDEPEREGWKSGTESPRHNVTIAKPFAIARYPVTRGEFAAFVNTTGHKMDGGAYVWDGKEWKKDLSKSWRDPGFPQDDRHPVVCASWEDAQAYIKWLREKTGKGYRLPNEAEWEYAARAGTVTPFWWGMSITPDQANYSGNYVYEGGGGKGVYREKTVPVNSFEANPWGVYQVHGNVWEWVEDRWHDDYNGAPGDGSAWISGGGNLHVVRGGSWFSYPCNLRAADRDWDPPDSRTSRYGFRLSRTL